MKTEPEIQISLDGVLTIQNAKEIKSKLLHAVNNHNNISIDCKNVTKIDVPILQLFIAAKTTATDSKKDISFQFEFLPSQKSILTHSGFTKLIDGLNN